MNDSWSDQSGTQLATDSIDVIRQRLACGHPEEDPWKARRYRFFSPQRKVGSILDFGCGLGRNFPTLERLCERLYATDIRAMMDRCKDLQPLQRVRFLHSPFERKFDVVVATLTLHCAGERDGRLCSGRA